MLRLIQLAMVGGIAYLIARSRAAGDGRQGPPQPLTPDEHLTLTWLERLGTGRVAWRLLIPRTEEDAAVLHRLYTDGVLLRRYADGRHHTVKQAVNDGAFYKLRPGAGRSRITVLRARRAKFGIEGGGDDVGSNG